MNELKNLKRYSSCVSGMISNNDKGRWVEYKDVENLLKEIGYLTDLNLKNDSHRHDIVFKGVNITYRLSVKKSHFWVYNRDTGQEIQYISHVSGRPGLYEKWESFIEDFWNEILEDMK